MAGLIRKREDRDESLLPDIWQEPLRMMHDMFRWDPFRAMERQMERVFPAELRGFAPDFEIKETASSYLFRADLPGVKEEDLAVELVGNRLTVSGHREAEERVEGETYYALERSYGNFRRSFTLPEGVDIDNARAALTNGVLTVTVPKKESQKGKRIPIGAGKEKQAKA